MAGPRRQKRNKVVRYRRPINIGVVFFSFVAVYLIVCVYMFFTASHISGYEVLAGSLTSDDHYTGIALRQEQVVTAEKAGYVNYYAREGEKVSPSSTVYTVDENGQMAELLQESAEGINLSEADYDLLCSQASAYTSAMTDMNFDELYDFKYEINASVLDIINQNMASQLDSAMSEGSGLFSRFTAGGSGIVEYYVDGFEEANLEGLTESWFDQESYERRNLRTEGLVSSGDAVYKLITDETWQLVFPVDGEMETYLRDKIAQNVRVKDDGESIQLTTYIEIRFEKDGENVWPSVTLEQREGKTYGVLKFVNSMVRYAGDRFLDFEILREEMKGLKIPVTTVTEKEFFSLPIAYLTNSGEDSGVMKQVFDENGERSVVFENMTIYYKDDESFYVDPKEEDFATSRIKLESGNTLVAENSTETFQVGEKKVLQGVYNINKGYALFRRIEILQQNEEYCIIKEGTPYGLSVYDHIVLNADAVEESEVVY